MRVWDCVWRRETTTKCTSWQVCMECYTQCAQKLLARLSSESSNVKDTESGGRSFESKEAIMAQNIQKRLSSNWHSIIILLQQPQKKAKDKLKHHVSGTVCQPPEDAPRFAFKSEYHRDNQESDPGLNSSISDPTFLDPQLKSSLSSANDSE